MAVSSRRYSLGVHLGHDRSAALVRNGELVAHIAEERLDRIKGSNSPDLPLRSIKAVLEIEAIGTNDVGVAGISYTNVEVGKIIHLLKDELRDTLSSPTLEVIGVDHHDGHAWSTYCTTHVEGALIVVADGSGDIVGDKLEAESVYIGSGNAIELVDRRLQEFGLSRPSRRNAFVLPYMHDIDRRKQTSLGHKYEQFTYLAGFGQREAGKTMGLAAYGRPLFHLTVPKMHDLQFSLTCEAGLVEIDQVWQTSGEPWHRFMKQRAADIAATGQKLVEEYMISLLNALNPKGYHKALCGAGGVFLNCQMNGRILTETKFTDVHVIPAAGDDGLSVGAAFYAYDKFYGPPKRGSSALPYLGKEYDRISIQRDLDKFGLTAEHLDAAELVESMSEDLASGKVLGLLRGRSEIGPRALCHRSILADPRCASMKDYLNALKGREIFRPFAPVVPVEDQQKYFELEQLSSFMLFATNLLPQFTDALPAIVHVDGSSRIQAVREEKEPFIHALLRSFEKRTGFPILLNTSFNLAGDPIVESPRDAILTFLKSDIDVLVIEGFRVDRKMGHVRHSLNIRCEQYAPQQPRSHQS